MIVVADTSPLNYLVQIQCEHLLPQLYGHIVLPAGVLQELSHHHAPLRVREWLSDLPAWIEIWTMQSAPSPDLSHLGLGERQAIQLAQERKADLVLIDELAGRAEATRRGLRVTGTLGILLSAAELKLIDPEDAYRRLLAETTFRTSVSLAAHFRRGQGPTRT